MDDGAPLRKRQRFSADGLSSSEDSTDDELSGGEGSEDSTTDELSSSEDSKADDELYDVWWRHSGEAEIESIPEKVTTTRCQKSKILEDIGDNEITHMKLAWTDLPSLHKIAPKLHSLWIGGLRGYRKADRLATFTQLKVLELPWNAFSDGLPQVVGELSSLTVLDIHECGLTNLPDKFDHKWKFPHCIGFIDGKHISIHKPEHSGSQFYNYKQRMSLVLLGIWDSNYKLIYIAVGQSGSNHDAGIWENTDFCKGLVKGTVKLPEPVSMPGDTTRTNFPYCLVGDEAFPLRLYMMRPYPSRSLDSDRKRVYNFRLSHARNSSPKMANSHETNSSQPGEM